jgi:hypothetical protein
MRRRRKRIIGGAAVVLFATVLGFAVSAGLSTSAGVLSATSGCTLTNGCESLLGFAGTTPTSPAIGTTTTVYFLDENGLGSTVDAVLTGPGVDESLPVTATAVTEIPSDGLFAYNPQYAGSGPNAGNQANYPTGCVFGTSDCLWELSFTVPATGLQQNKLYTVTLTAYDGDGDGDQVVWQVPFGSVDTPFDPAVGTALAVLAIGSVLLFRMNRRRPTAA